METTQVKKSELLYVAQERTNATLADYADKAREINEAFVEVDNLFPKPLSKEQKESLLLSGWPGVEELIRKEYGFPNGKVSTILDLEGLDASIAQGAFVNVSSWHSAIGFAITDQGVVELKPETIQKIKERNTHRCKNLRQSRALEFAQLLSESLNSQYRDNIITDDERRNTVKALSKYIQLNVARRTEQIVEPNPRAIAQLRF